MKAMGAVGGDGRTPAATRRILWDGAFLCPGCPAHTGQEASTLAFQRELGPRGQVGLQLGDEAVGRVLDKRSGSPIPRSLASLQPRGPSGAASPTFVPRPLSYPPTLCQPSNAKLLLCICPPTSVPFAPSKVSSLTPCEHSWEQGWCLQNFTAG